MLKDLGNVIPFWLPPTLYPGFNVYHADVSIYQSTPVPEHSLMAASMA